MSGAMLSVQLAVKGSSIVNPTRLELPQLAKDARQPSSSPALTCASLRTCNRSQPSLITALLVIWLVVETVSLTK